MAAEAQEIGGYVSTRTASEISGYSRAYLLHLLTTGRIPALVVSGRFFCRLDDVRAYAQGKTSKIGRARGPMITRE